MGLECATFDSYQTHWAKLVQETCIKGEGSLSKRHLVGCKRIGSGGPLATPDHP